MSTDADLLRQFSETRDEAAFATLVQRHIGFVYAISARRLRDPHAAQDATQAVFVALARKAATVAQGPSVMGWLHRSACYETKNLMRAQINRVARETEAQRRGTTVAESQPDRATLEAVIDEALGELSFDDREAILARYFSGSSYAEIGASLQLNENAARMRVDRALAKLRRQLERRGVTSTAAVLATALPAYASAPVPRGLAAGVTQASLAGVAGVGAGGTAAGALIGFMSTTTKVLVGVALVAAVGGALYEFQRACELEARLEEAAAVRPENASAQRQIALLRREIADLKAAASLEQEQAAARAAAAAAAPRPVIVPVAAGSAAPAAPLPGVKPVAPKGWWKNGSANDLYEVGTDENNSWGGMPSAYAKSTGAADGKFGGMMQTISAEAYRGQRIRLNGWVKTEEANDGGGHLWLRIDGQQSGQMLGFDNMSGRAPTGTTDWQDYSIVLDVPAEATKVNYGFFVQGKGQMWVNGVTITPVAVDVESTDMIKKQKSSALPATPVNLGFAPPKS